METEQRFEIMQRQMDAESGEVRTLDDSTRTVELSFSSETPVERWGVSEILSHKSGAVMLERLNKTGCLLYNHNRDKVIGKVIKASVKNRRGIATVQFDDDDESLIYYNKVKNGTLRNVSVGYIVHEQQRTATGKGETMHVTYTATKWEPIEISIVSVPADISVGVGRSVTENGQIKNYVDYRMKINQNLIKIARRNKFR
ncbi:MAG TPA: HK97 family phage prohead protease [Candidatus Ornithomonoglobus merdipullorum]|uniref:HK97 family phage prohead protease n=1 Tax=Candidatus Ornithomonoglobus merdipullorum TaxID=2840895 RepID=A0A9D1M9J1_9FIRM|nr:HK97 family phage prohead protease [Candidatus Ornithomonoglobus merdipullorum]